MAFTPYTIDTNSAATSYTVVGLTPGKQYSFQVTAKNSLGPGPISTALTTTMAAQSTSSTPTVVQSATFRSDSVGGVAAAASITLSLPNTPSAANAVWVFFNGYAGGTGGQSLNSGAITAPSGATPISGPNYDSVSEVTQCWLITANVNSNSFTFSNFDTNDNAGWKIVEVANGETYGTPTHGAVTSATTTAVTWPLTTATSTPFLGLTELAIQFGATIVSGGTGITIVKQDPISTTPYHQGVILSDSSGITTGSINVTGGTAADTDTYISINIYGAALPVQVTNLTAANVTTNGVKLSWSSVAGASSYTILYEGGGVSTFTQFGLPIAASSSTVTLGGLIPNTSYSFEVFASNASGQGNPSTSVPIATLSVQPIAVMQSAAIAKTTSGSGATGTLTATFGSAPTIGNTLAFFYTGFADANNLALTAPAGALNSTGILQDDGTSTDPIGMFWTQVVTAAATNYSFGVVDDECSLIVVEMQGVTSIGTPLHGGNLTSTDGSSGSVVVPVAAPSTTPAITLVAVNMTNTVDSWGSAPTNMLLLQGITGVSSTTPTYHSGAVFSASSAVSGNQTIPYSLAVGTQVAAPIYITVPFYGSAGVIPPGQTVVTLGAVTSSTQVLTWTTPTGTTTSYTVQYRQATSTTWLIFSSSITALTATVTGLSAAISYQYQVIAYNGTQAGPSSATVTGSTLASSPSQVTGLTLGTVTSTTQSVSWTSPGGTITSYTLQYKLASAGSFTPITGLTGTTTVVTGLAPSNSYVYQVFALNGTNAGPVSTTVTGSTLALPAPGQPTNLILGTPTSTTIPVSWTASTGTVTTYSILYNAISSSGPWTTLQGVTSVSTTITGLQPSYIYYVEIIAYNGTTPSAASTVSNTTTAIAPAPGQVVGLTIGTTSSTSQALSWSVPSGTVTTYTVQYEITGTGTFTNITGITTNSYTVTGLAPVTPYTYQVFALNTTVQGSPSTTVAFTTLTASGTAGSQLVTIGGKILIVNGKMVIA